MHFLRSRNIFCILDMYNLCSTFQNQLIIHFTCSETSSEASLPCVSVCKNQTFDHTGSCFTFNTDSDSLSPSCDSKPLPLHTDSVAPGQERVIVKQRRKEISTSLPDHHSSPGECQDINFSTSDHDIQNTIEDTVSPSTPSPPSLTVMKSSVAKLSPPTPFADKNCCFITTAGNSVSKPKSGITSRYYKPSFRKNPLTCTCFSLF